MELLVLAGGRVWPRGRLSCCKGAEMGTGLLRSTRLFSPSETVDQAVETYGLQKITLLREISLKTGIQVGMGQCPFISQLPQGPQGWGGGGSSAPSPHMGVYWEVLAMEPGAETACGYVGVGYVPQILLKEYSFDSRHKPAFTEEDVLNIFPVVKHVNPKASDAFHFFQSGQAKVQQGAWPDVAGGKGGPPAKP